jgi:peptidoglycan hydrolase-like protein with peptidoglycan-binding domain
MESLAFIHHSVAYSDPSPEPQLRDFNLAEWRIPSSAWMGVVGAIAFLTIVSAVTPAEAMIYRKGNTGAGVAEIQRALGIPADGVFGPQTEAAILRYQIAMGLLADGKAGPETLTALGLTNLPVAVAPASTGRSTAGRAVIVTRSGVGVNLRSSPNGPISGGLADGAAVSVTGREVAAGGYVWAELSDGQWVATSFLQGSGAVAVAPQGVAPLGITTSPATTATVSTRSGGGVNLRRTPNGEVVGGLPNGAVVFLTGAQVPAGAYLWAETSDGAWIATDFLASSAGTRAIAPPAPTPAAVAPAPAPVPAPAAVAPSPAPASPAPAPVTADPAPPAPVAEEPIVEDPVAEEPVAEDPVAEAPVTEDPVTEEPTAEDPVAEEPTIEDPVADAADPVEDPVAEEPDGAEEPVAEDPTPAVETAGGSILDLAGDVLGSTGLPATVPEDPEAEAADPVPADDTAAEPEEPVEEPVAEEPTADEDLALDTIDDATEPPFQGPSGTFIVKAPTEVRSAPNGMPITTLTPGETIPLTERRALANGTIWAEATDGTWVNTLAVDLDSSQPFIASDPDDPDDAIADGADPADPDAVAQDPEALGTPTDTFIGPTQDTEFQGPSGTYTAIASVDRFDRPGGSVIGTIAPDADLAVTPRRTLMGNQVWAQLEDGSWVSARQIDDVIAAAEAEVAPPDEVANEVPEAPPAVANGTPPPAADELVLQDSYVFRGPSGTFSARATIEKREDPYGLVIGSVSSGEAVELTGQRTFALNRTWAELSDGTWVDIRNLQAN